MAAKITRSPDVWQEDALDADSQKNSSQDTSSSAETTLEEEDNQKQRTGESFQNVCQDSISEESIAILRGYYRWLRALSIAFPGTNH